jgi:hypothetical protein
MPSLPVSPQTAPSKHGRFDGPTNVAEPDKSRMAEQWQGATTEGRGGAAVRDVDLGPLAVELGLSDVARIA